MASSPSNSESSGRSDAINLDYQAPLSVANQYQDPAAYPLRVRSLWDSVGGHFALSGSADLFNISQDVAYDNLRRHRDDWRKARAACIDACLPEIYLHPDVDTTDIVEIQYQPDPAIESVPS